MEKQKRWQFAVILTVIILTLYNILPTIIFYMKPLRSPITAERAEVVEKEIANRVNDLEEDARDWVASFCDLIHVKPKEIVLNVEDPAVIKVTFNKKEDAKHFRRLLPRAGIEIPFVPSQLALSGEDEGEEVTLLRRQSFHFNRSDLAKLFAFSMMEQDVSGVREIAPLYYDIESERVATLAHVASLQPLAKKFEEIRNTRDSTGQEVLFLARELVSFDDALRTSPAVLKRTLSTIAQARGFQSAQLIGQLSDEKKKIELRVQSINQEMKERQEKKQLVDQEKVEQAKYLEGEIQTLNRAIAIVQKNKDALIAQEVPSKIAFKKELDDQWRKSHGVSTIYTVSVGQYNPFIRAFVIDWENGLVAIKLHEDVASLLSVSKMSDKQSEEEHIREEAISTLVMNEVARLSQETEEKIQAVQGEYQIALNKLTGARSFLALRLPEVGQALAGQLQGLVQSEWTPKHHDLARENFPVVSEGAFTQLQGRDKNLCLAIFVPQNDKQSLPGLREGSIYVVLRGVKNIMDQYQKNPESEDAEIFNKDFMNLATLLYKRGFVGYPGSSSGLPEELQNDYIFELPDFYSMLLKATREDFYVLGSKKDAILEFSDVEQRILTLNKVEDAIQEDLLRWKEAYSAAQVDMNPARRYTVPKPTKNAFFENLKLGVKKYFRGDDKKILRWGLDLSGGKSVRIALVDHSGKRVDNPQDLRQAVNELYTRINKMGVSERTIRIENQTILLDFPGSQALSAQELVKASAMYFHVVNEQFGPYNKNLAKEVNQFLQEVWNEAVVTNRTDVEGLNEIAYQKLSRTASTGTTFGPRTSAETLYQQGLRLADPHGTAATAAFDDSLSTIARFRIDDSSEWSNQTHPLLIVFHNYALEGSSLENIHTGYDPSKGNTLLFGVKSSYAQEGIGQEARGGSPRDDFYAWTAPFSEEKIVGTPREAYSQGRGWRMAVVLNGSVVNAPSLNSPLRDHAMITGHFSQREVSKLATDLSAGSLSFTPKILSEQNVSPELGQEERSQSITASVIAVAIVVGMMCGYYHFAGLVASIAVLFNILVIWAVMQNIDAVLTLPGIAGMVLTVGMAVDANVLVFERIREEFKLSGRIASAIQAGYRKAFSAIFDSNITTILVALILLQFDCGPIRGFAMTLIIGITASMFTALFMTRYYFAGWVQNPNHKELTMSDWIGVKNYNFLAKTKVAVIASCVLFAVGVIAFATSYRSMVGMDFTGGYSLVVELEEMPNKNMREIASDALRSNGISGQEFHIRELGRPNLLRIQLSTSLEDNGNVFHGMPEDVEAPGALYAYEHNPRITWVVKTLESQGLAIRKSSLDSLGNNWTVMSGQFSDVMRKNALYALTLALLGVLFYIAFRFEWKYAISSLLALLHDVLLTLAVAAIAHKMGAPVQINLEMVGALMMIIGYSLNDTIIVFDRIREDIRLYRKLSFREIINLALNATLSRTVLTSSTTFMVLVALVLFGGSSIFGFAFVMMTGVFLGTLSSLFIACPILLYLHNRDQIEYARE